MSQLSSDPISGASLAGRTAFVTGGGRGLGAAICGELARAGAHVVVADLDEARARGVAERLARDGARAVPLGVDVGDETSVRHAFDAARESLGDIDVIVNNAAIDVTAAIDDVSVDAWRQVLTTNLFGPYLLCHAAVPMMKARGRGHIVNIASTAAKRAWPNASAYHATKWGCSACRMHCTRSCARRACMCRRSSRAACARRSCSIAFPTSTPIRCSRPSTSRRPCASCSRSRRAR